MKKIKTIVLLVITCLSLSFGTTETHKVSWYGKQFHGRLTASGEVYNKWGMTCAATNRYKLGTYLAVTNMNNGKKVIVKVNDRGGFAKHGRTLDLSRGAFEKIANINKGVIQVKIKKVKNLHNKK